MYNKDMKPILLASGCSGPGPDDAMAASTAASPQEPPASASHLPADFFQAMPLIPSHFAMMTWLPCYCWKQLDLQTCHVCHPVVIAPKGSLEAIFYGVSVNGRQAPLIMKMVSLAKNTQTSERLSGQSGGSAGFSWDFKDISILCLSALQGSLSSPGSLSGHSQ